MGRKARAAHTVSIGGVIAGALWRHPFRSIAAVLSVVASIVLEVLPPLVLASAVDELTQSRAVSLSLALGYFALVACSGLADAVREALIVAVGEGITHALRTAMMQKLRRLPASYFTDHEAGAIASLHVNDVDAIEDMFSSGLVSMFSDLGTVVSILVVVFTKSLGLGVLLLIALPLLSAFTVHVQRKMLVAHTENRRATAQANGILPETLHIIRSLHVYRAERFAQARYDRAIQHSFRAMETTNFYDAVYSPVIITASAAVIAVMMSLSGQSGAFRELFGMTVGTAVALISYVNSIFTPLSSIGMEIQTVQSAAAGWKRVQEYLDEEERPACEPRVPRSSSRGVVMNLADFEAAEAATSKGAVRGAATGVPALESEVLQPRIVPAPCAVVEVCHVSFSYDEAHPVLRDLSLLVHKGEFVTLTGRTGAGKSTLFKLLLGLYEPDEGSIRVCGLCPEDMIDADRRRIVACVEQKLIAVPGTIRDQVTLGNPAFDDALVWQALGTAGLEETVASFPARLDTPYKDSLFSQGQKQLLMIARAIVSDPQVLLLDEITAGLDSATEKQVTEALKKASAHRTVVSISHRLSEEVVGRIVPLD